MADDLAHRGRRLRVTDTRTPTARHRTFTVTPARPEDASAIAGLWHRHLRETSDVVDPTFTPAFSAQKTGARLKRALVAGTLLGWIARAEGQSKTELAGYLTAKVQTADALFGDVFEYAPVLYIVDVDVEAAFRRRGVSRLLLDEATRYAREHRIDTLELASVVRDTRSVTAWKRQGFEARVVVMRRAVTGKQQR